METMRVLCGSGGEAGEGNWGCSRTVWASAVGPPWPAWYHNMHMNGLGKKEDSGVRIGKSRRIRPDAFRLKRGRTVVVDNRSPGTKEWLPLFGVVLP